MLAHAAAVHGLQVSVEQVELGRIGLKRLGVVGKSNQRDRRSADDELDRLIDHFDANPRQLVPMAGSSSSRSPAPCARRDLPRHLERSQRPHQDADHPRPHGPRQKKGNDQRILLLAVSSYDALAPIEEQRAIRSNEDERIFPYNHVSNVFTRACRTLRIEDLHFHDLRHEAGFRIEQVSLVTGHKDWKMLRRCTHLKRESLHDFARGRHET